MFQIAQRVFLIARRAAGLAVPVNSAIVQGSGMFCLKWLDDFCFVAGIRPCMG